MHSRRNFAFIVSAVTALAVAALSACAAPQPVQVGPTSSPAAEPIGMPNPASVFCANRGGTLEIIKTEAGETGVCVFSDGSKCDEWAFYRGECKPGQSTQAEPATPQPMIPNPASSFCVDNGGQLEIVDQEAGGQIGVCHFPDGSQCEEWSYYRGECKPGLATAVPPMTPEANMPNPASAYCEQVSGELKIEKTDAGEIGICVFSDGSQCEEWALFNNECQPGLATAVPSVTPRIAMPDPSATFCVKHGGKVRIMTRRDGGQYALCVFKNGSRCDTWAFYRGKCHPATPTPKPQKRIIGMRNPASVYCAQQGGTHQIMTMMDGSEVGICVFPNGNQCEEWALYHGQCSP